MGGEGSGRKPDITNKILKEVKEERTAIANLHGDSIYLPNYSGIKDSARKDRVTTTPCNWTLSGSDIYYTAGKIGLGSQITYPTYAVNSISNIDASATSGGQILLYPTITSPGNTTAYGLNATISGNYSTGTQIQVTGFSGLTSDDIGHALYGGREWGVYGVNYLNAPQIRYARTYQALQGSWGINHYVQFQNLSNVFAIKGFNGINYAPASYGTGKFGIYYCEPVIGVGAFTDFYGYLSITPTKTTGSCTNYYSIFLEESKIATNNYGFYISGSNMLNYIAGNLNISGNTIVNNLSGSNLEFNNFILSGGSVKGNLNISGSAIINNSSIGNITISGSNLTISSGAVLSGSSLKIDSLSELTLSGSVVLGSSMTAYDHLSGSTARVVNVCYGTSATPPTASTTTEGTLYVQYTP